MYYPCGVRWQQQDGFLLWQDPPEPARESIWVDTQSMAPLFATAPALAAFAQHLGYDLVKQVPPLIDLDSVASWLKDDKKHPLRECLAVWNLFDDVGAGTGKPFAGNYKTPLRNRVFDLLYADSGPWQTPSKAQWPLAEQTLLRDILTQGFALWQQHVCWQA
jgi:hypothetical protein